MKKLLVKLIYIHFEKHKKYFKKSKSFHFVSSDQHTHFTSQLTFTDKKTCCKLCTASQRMERQLRVPLKTLWLIVSIAPLIAVVSVLRCLAHKTSNSPIRCSTTYLFLWFESVILAGGVRPPLKVMHTLRHSNKLWGPLQHTTQEHESDREFRDKNNDSIIIELWNKQKRDKATEQCVP